VDKVKSVLELSRYKLDEKAWWVALRPQEEVEPIFIENWMIEHHPKIIYGGPAKVIWSKTAGKYGAKLPKLHHQDFEAIVGLTTSKFSVESFIIKQITRSTDTGEYLYINDDEIWMPESCLFDSAAAARLEKKRIVKLLHSWIKYNV
jgi:hypothetical protein